MKIVNRARGCKSPNLPVLLDVERPLELEMGVVVVVDEFGHGIIVAAGQHAGGCCL